MKKSLIISRYYSAHFKRCCRIYTLSRIFSKEEKMEIGKEAPNFVVTDLEGKKIELKDFKEKVYF